VVAGFRGERIRDSSSETALLACVLKPLWDMWTIGRSLFTAALVAFAACGDNITISPTPGTLPERAKGPIKPGLPDPVTVTISRGGIPQPDVEIFFQNADSSLVLAAKTDATGTASAYMAAGGYVTAVDPFPPVLNMALNTEVDTWAGVKPGDHLVLAAASLLKGTAYQITLPYDRLEASATVDHYIVATTCGSGAIYVAPPPAFGGLPSTLTDWVTLRCPDRGGADVMVVSEDSSFNPLHYFYRPDVAFSTERALDLSESAYLSPAERTYTYTGAPDWLTSLSFQVQSKSSRGLLYGKVGYATGSGTLTATLRVPTFDGALEVVEAQTPPTGFTAYYLYDWGAFTAPFNGDLAKHLLRTFASSPSFDPATREVSWTESADGPAGDLNVIQISANRPDTRSWSWRIAAPHAMAVTLPQLPSDGFDYNIAPTDNWYLGQAMIGSVPGGYDAARAQLLSSFISGIGASPNGSMSFAFFAD
jgi:hypothetical protein